MVRATLGHENRVLLQKATKGDVGSLAKLLSLVENNLRQASKFLATLKENKKSVRLGITGPPGAGKSSLINSLIHIYRREGYKIGVIAVDPSSPFSGGALLGDRIRMSEHAADKNVFIRSIGSRGGIGGVSAATGAMAAVLEACGFDIVIIETVGVGQTELQIMHLADLTAVVLVPESGDVVQTLKAGILEIADVFVVNKADRPGADTLSRELVALVELEGERQRPVFVTSVTEKKGVDDLANFLIAEGKVQRVKRRHSPERLREQLRMLLLSAHDEKLQGKLQKSKIKNVYDALAKWK